MNQQEQLASLRRPGGWSGGRRKNLGTLLLLLAFLAGAVLVFVLVFGQRLQPRVAVSAVPAVLLESDELAPATAPETQGPLLAQASGWIEPDPFPVRVPVKVDGFVESVLVYEGDAVREGQLLATLDATNHTLRVEQLTASLEEARALLRVREQEIEQAGRERTVAEAGQTVAEARLREAEDRLKRIRTLEPGNLSEVAIIAVERAETEALAALRQAVSHLARADSVVETRRAERLRQEAGIAALLVELEQAKVNLARTRVSAPMDGIVLKRFAAPGMKRMASMDDPDSATIVSLYDPAHLQVRVDVPLSDAWHMATGLSARVMTAALPGQVLTGRVRRITGEADLARNTLQVHVALKDPAPILRPEMLCRVEFFAPPSGERAGGTRLRRVWLPEKTLREANGNSVTVWVVDPVKETVAQRELELGTETRDGFRVVLSGLRPGEQVVTESARRLEPGARVTVQGAGRP